MSMKLGFFIHSIDMWIGQPVSFLLEVKYIAAYGRVEQKLHFRHQKHINDCQVYCIDGVIILSHSMKDSKTTVASSICILTKCWS